MRDYTTLYVGLDIHKETIVAVAMHEESGETLGRKKFSNSPVKLKAYLKSLEKSGIFSRPVATELLKAAPFFPAEEYHQQYTSRQPLRYKLYREASGREQFIREHWKGKSCPIPGLSPSGEKMESPVPGDEALFIGNGKKYDISLQGESLALEPEHRHKLHYRH
ncbi:MAG: peptide-methionine (S)-S-oxide reductase [Candidatus Eremiobacteraeota bacterium]|nr:peptide-methionine (S)-S-oxide reductase [Candidatus Eremiobacteraeota bacterium]